MTGAGNFLESIARGIAGLIEGAFLAFGAAMQAALRALQSILPGFWLPVVAFIVAIVVFWQFIKR